jgi:hypothetical protein
MHKIVTHESDLQHLIGKTIKTVEMESDLNLFIEFTDGCNIFVEPVGEEIKDAPEPWMVDMHLEIIAIIVNSYTDSLDEI